MTRSEEQLRVGTETREAGRARLRKHVVTEHQQATVPVSHEEVTLEREPITDANRGDAYDGPAISEEEHEVTLHASSAPWSSTEAVAVERVRLGNETVTETRRPSAARSARSRSTRSRAPRVSMCPAPRQRPEPTLTPHRPHDRKGPSPGNARGQRRTANGRRRLIGQTQQAQAGLPENVDTDRDQGLLAKIECNAQDLIGSLGAGLGL